MQRTLLLLCVLLSAACSGENDRVTGADPKRTLDDVQGKVEAAGEAAEARLDDALDALDESTE